MDENNVQGLLGLPVSNALAKHLQLGQTVASLTRHLGPWNRLVPTSWAGLGCRVCVEEVKGMSGVYFDSWYRGVAWREKKQTERTTLFGARAIAKPRKPAGLEPFPNSRLLPIAAEACYGSNGHSNTAPVLCNSFRHEQSEQCDHEGMHAIVLEDGRICTRCVMILMGGIDHYWQP